MLRNVQDLQGLPIGATDGVIGKTKDFYFDDEAWVIRYLVIDTSTWLGGRDVLVSPYSIGEIASIGDAIPVKISKGQIRNSPSIDTDKPISRQYERGYLGYYGYPYYWGGTGLWGGNAYPGTMLTGMGPSNYDGYLKAPSADDVDGDPHLRSCKAVKGYHLRATDGDLGHVDGFLIDDHTWSVRYLIAKTGNWWAGHDVLVSPEWIERVSWSESMVTLALSRQAIKDSPPYDADALPDRDAESAVYLHYGRNGYWRGGRETANPLVLM
jgi:hypothetical protein